MDRETAELALRFLDRVDLKGAEVPAFVKVRNALNAMMAAAKVAEGVPPAEEGEAGE